MNILVFGATGQVARELQLLISGSQVHEAQFLDRAAADLSQPETCAAAIRAAAPDAVINAAAYTAVDRAEDEEELASTINGAAPGAMAQACAALAIPLVHISTDYVFAGDGDTPWTPTDPVAPQNAYGRSKRAGEEAVRAAGGTHAILRTSWVVSAFGNNFVKTMLRLGAERDKLTIVADQIGAPTCARDIARTCLAMAEQLQSNPEKSGTYHFSGTPLTSWAGFAREIFAQARLSCAVEDIPSSAYPTPATRPLNSRLDCSATKTTFGQPCPDWRDGLREILKDLET